MMRIRGLAFVVLLAGTPAFSADEPVAVHGRVVDAVSGAAASENLRFASAVAAFGMLLRDSAHKGTATFEMVDSLARSALSADSADKAGYRAEFLALAARAQQLTEEVRAAQR